MRRMFERFIRLARAEKALREGRLEDALQQALDPVVAGVRRAVVVREAAVAGLLARGHERLREADGRAALAIARQLQAWVGDGVGLSLLAAAEAACASSGNRAGGDPAADPAARRALLDRAGQLLAAGDCVGAGRKLAELPATSRLLRTRIHDMKQELARAQGLDGGFVLRVDDAGEFLVLRGEGASFGGLRQARADVPVLANLAGRHASVRRSMSFHGGLQDIVVAEEGEVRVGSERVERCPLAHGDRVQFGPAFAFVYERPSPRSLTARLSLQGGFAVAGCAAILLMKDRGRDGRILIGPGADAHVRVPTAKGEVELFAGADGQVRVAAAGGGRIDGAPFDAEHPVTGGQWVEAAGVAFRLAPWRPTA
jgi:hypothetical protein